MAWRIEDHIVRGEIDNRVRDRITGRIWFVGRDEPIELDLTGNAWRDVAGRCLEFVNPSPVAGKVPILTRQVGVIGDCSASVKMKIPEIPFDEVRQRMKEGQPFPWHWGNCMYLEWFSQTNGRVVIQSHDYKLTLTPEATWEMSEEEQVIQREVNAEALQDFMRALADLRRARGDVFEDPYRDDEEEAEEGEIDVEDEDASDPEFEEDPEDDEVDEDKDEEDDDDEGWESERPLSEEEAEEMQKESDRLADRIQARLDREGPDADFGKILREELERRRKERGEKPLTPEEEAERAAWVDEMNRAAKEAIEHPDPDDEAAEEYEHPAAQQAFELTTRLHRDVESVGWVPQEAGAEHPLVDLVSSVSCAGAKMAGALNGENWPPEVDTCASKIVRLKRARGFFEDAALALNACDEQELADAAWRAAIRREVEALTRTTDELIAELRARLDRGFD